MRRQKQHFPAIRPDLHQFMVRWWFERLLRRKRVAVELGRAEFAGMPEALFISARTSVEHDGFWWGYEHVLVLHDQPLKL